MNTQVVFTLTLKISPVDLSEFLKVVNCLVDDTAAEKGALAYEYHITSDNSTIAIYERYIDSDAAIFHIINTYPPYAESFAKLTTTESFFIQGGITDQLRKTMDGTQACLLQPLIGFDRS